MLRGVQVTGVSPPMLGVIPCGICGSGSGGGEGLAETGGAGVDAGTSTVGMGWHLI
jgi:hypothetical protein